MKNIVLIGFMGTGKSTVGRLLAQRMGSKFVDTDKEIEEITGLTAAQLINKHGIIRFRSEESLVVKKLAEQTGLVIATGGGTLLDPENRRLLAINGVFIHLLASVDAIYQRVKGKKKDRPLLAKGDLKEQITKLLKERQDLYQEADFTIDTDQTSLEKVVEEICSKLEVRGSKFE